MWAVAHTEKFPRSHRAGLGRRIDDRLESLLDDLIEAKYTSDKAEILRRAGLQAEQIRYQFRLAKDLRLLAPDSHRHAIVLLDDIGRQLGGWRRKNEG
ncbi:MAG: four helix bundle protein [Planctomycetota bacterium]|nr:four helix bundle protein [Planctomycetota bacterium]